MSILSNTDVDFLHDSKVTWKKIQTARIKEGFVDGKYMGEESTIQEGFNDGYKVGFKSNFQVAVLKGILGALEVNLGETKSTYLPNAVQLKNEIIKLEHFCLEVEKNRVSRSCANPSDKDNHEDLTFDDEDDTHTNKYLVDTNSLEKDQKIMSEKLSSVKQKTLKFLQESGFTDFGELIYNI